ncbi:MAG TPA: hypothetical protein PLJ04_01205 [Candidatus Saccharibacteria bacterium]|nr:hypothetical protein [Candidatus Nomurabacteria bacterium]HPR10175.1 hypothetical protein [Candidatus Saccharibacteria bacterium]
MPPNNQMPTAPNIFVPPAPGQVPNPMSPQLPPDPKTPVWLIVAMIIATLLAIVFLVLTVLFYMQMSDYKNNSDQKSAAAVEQAKATQAEELKLQFAEQEKEPLKSYTAPGSAASTKIVYPKTWSLYAVEGQNGNSVDAFFNPNIVPDTTNKGNVYALRMQVLDKPYATVVKEYDAPAKKGEVRISPYKPEQVSAAEQGVRIDGVVRDKVSGTMVILPVRDKTIKIWTETENYVNDFNNFVLKNLEYSP